MADVTAGESAAPEADGKAAGGSKKRLILIAAAAVVLLGLVGFGATMFLGGGSDTPPPPPQPVFVDLPEMTINLAGVGDRPHYLRTTISLELPDEATKAAIDPVMPRVLDAFQVYLRELRPADISGSAGIQRLKEELVRRVNLAIHPAEITGVAFKEIIVQ